MIVRMDMAEHRARCQCGALMVEATQEPDLVVACNCVACQRRTGSPFGVSGFFLKSSITVSGDYKTWDRVAESGRNLTSHFCPLCGTNVFWTLDMRPDHVAVAAGCFETKLPEPARAIWTESKHDWVEFPDHWPQHEKMTPGT